MLYAVTLLDRKGRSRGTVNNLDENTARELADRNRGSLCASYIHDETRRLDFKKPKLSPVKVPGYWAPGTRRLSATQIEAAAKRFEVDGEHDNAANMRALV